MKTLNATLLTLLSMLLASPAFAWNISAYCTANKELDDDHFLIQFPYEDYLSNYTTSPLAQTQDCRTTLRAAGREAVADPILYEATERFLKEHPIDATDLVRTKAELLVAETFLQFRAPTDSALEFITHSIGDRYMGAAAYHIEEALAAKQIEKEDATLQAILEILHRNQYNPNIPVSNAEKLWTNAKEGNWGYIWNRFRTRYLLKTVLALSLGLNFLLLARPLLRRIRRFLTSLISRRQPQFSENPNR
ncbi:MAG: hypothetical protein U0176_21420 [Bacteroidia bacterium]